MTGGGSPYDLGCSHLITPGWTNGLIVPIPHHVHGLHVPQFRWILMGSELSLVGMICMVKCDQNPGSTGLTRQGLNRLCWVLTPGIQRCVTSGLQTCFAGKSEQKSPIQNLHFSRSRAKLFIHLPYGGVSIYGGTPIAGWFTMGNPKQKWIWG